MDQEVVVTALPSADPPPATHGERREALSPHNTPTSKQDPAVKQTRKPTTLLDLQPEVLHHVVEHVSFVNSISYSLSGV